MKKVKYILTVGRFLVGSFIRDLKSRCFEMDVELTIKEDKGFLDTQFYLTLVGPEEKLRVIDKFIDVYMTDD